MSRPRRASPAPTAFFSGATGAIGLVAFLVAHLVWLRDVPGLHFDEAWAANFSTRILREPGFLPFQAMSPYTSAWAHYLTSFFFALTRVDVFHYRAAGVIMQLVGILFMSLALKKRGETGAALLLPGVVACLPGAVLNHRFVIEITSFHVLCLGLLCFGVATLDTRKGKIATASALLFGITSHILFTAPALALLALALKRGELRKHRVLATVIVLPVLAFFFRIHASIPEKDKALALILVTLAAGALPWLPKRVLNALRKLLSRALPAAELVSLPLLATLFFFMEGSWSEVFHVGRLEAPLLAGTAAVFPLATIVLGRKRVSPRDRDFLDWAWMSWIIAVALAVKPAPRYFEVPMLLAAIGLAVLLARLELRKRIALLTLGLFASGVSLGFNYFSPIRSRAPLDRELRFLFFHDSTSDTLSKQRLVDELSALGCDRSKAFTDDPRIGEALFFLSRGDWVAREGAACPWDFKAKVSRLSRAGPGPALREIGPFVVTQK